MPLDALKSRSASVAAGLIGIAVLILGTFLPWLRSGRTTRNSYEATGAVRRLVAPDGILGELFRVWPLIGALCAVAIAAYALGLRLIGLAIGLLASLAGGGAAIAALNASDSAYASVIDTGPAITIAGAAIVLVSVGAHFVTNGVIRKRPDRVREEQ